jgi:AraC-like DNA-binding protein
MARARARRPEEVTAPAYHRPVAYRELPPPRPVAPLLAGLWLRDAEPVRRRRPVVPDGCVDIVLIEGRRPQVAGPATAPTVPDVPAQATVLGVRFRVGAAGAALGWPAADLRDATVALEELWGHPAVEAIVERTAAAGADPERRLHALTDAVIAELPPPDGLDRAIRAAAVSIAAPGARAERLGDRVGLGERQLRRRFADAVGYGPKTLQRVLRFQRFLALARGTQARAGGGDLARLAFDAGYADQAHLTNECRRLAGLTPAALLAVGIGPAGERTASFTTLGPAAGRSS